MFVSQQSHTKRRLTFTALGNTSDAPFQYFILFSLQKSIFFKGVFYLCSNRFIYNVFLIIVTKIMKRPAKITKLNLNILY